MSTTKIEELILRMENYLECWKQFHNFMNMARQKKFTQEDENQFMEIKSVLTQELELILCSMDCGSISRDDVHTMIRGTLRYPGWSETWLQIVRLGLANDTIHLSNISVSDSYSF